MKQSMRAKRMARHHKRNQAKSKLSLVSLMDIFTILVFFLMLNASDVQVLQSDDSVSLPISTADKAAAETLLMLVTPSEVLIQGRKVSTTAALARKEKRALEALKAELDYHTARKSQLPEEKASQQATAQTMAQSITMSITIMGDSQVEYAVLKQIMQVCASAGYTKLALAVENKSDTGSALSAGGMQ
ncbi:ExbD/TolR family protein [Agaribacter marinus]|uniref:RNA polymerase subunit sigma-70 n=1 Tax=Agaribacter marinus TaxID=1431249 RepID=A0AA37SZA4_9ALTE|nr:biopolymer transporter ExbD [Agaribacter marinus]GLR71339.1 hypothetical protein GCM10007852_22470 [Agaribacter marinus]